MAETSDAYGNVEIYELETTGLIFDIPFWESLLEDWEPRRVLELGCGTGRVLLPLLEKGVALRQDFEIVGLDTSAPLLARAQERLDSLGPIAAAARLVQVDMRDFVLDSEFDLIIAALNTFAHLLTTRDQLGCLAAVKRHLAPDGRFAFDLLTPQYEFLSAAQTSLPLMRFLGHQRAPTADIEWFVQQASEEYDAESQILRRIYVSEIMTITGEVRRFYEVVDFRMIFPQELELLLQASRLVPQQRFGNVRRAPFGKGSMQYTWIVGHV